ncbi:hypothetical protein C2E23DRAFT_731757 [Lenzites betulinus]|nr:hypothetical protein C2E23DRAFT_731757 [Lenzites betulinus]
MEQTNQTGEAVAILLAARTVGTQTRAVIETDSRTVLEALTKWRRKHEDTGYILQKNGQLTRAVIAAMRAREADTVLKWVKGHAGHKRNEGADKLAAEGAAKEQEDDIDLTCERKWVTSGAKIMAMTQKIAYRAIRGAKESGTEERRRTTAILKRTMEDLERATGSKATTTMIWKATRAPQVSKECGQFLWKVLHDAFMVGESWMKANMSEQLRARATCRTCNVTETMEHILFKCRAAGSQKAWELVERLWKRTGAEWIEPSWGTVVAAACVSRGGRGKERRVNEEKRWTAVATETAYVIWKLRCERVIQNEGRNFSDQEVEARWRSAMNRRLTLDRDAAAPRIGKAALKRGEIEQIWSPLLEINTPANWMEKYGVLVGIRID